MWRYNLSEHKNSRLAYGKIIVPGQLAALRRAAEICAGGYQPGSLLLDRPLAVCPRVTATTLGKGPGMGRRGRLAPIAPG